MLAESVPVQVTDSPPPKPRRLHGQEWVDARVIAYALDHLANAGGGAYGVKTVRETRERFMADSAASDA